MSEHDVGDVGEKFRREEERVEARSDVFKKELGLGDLFALKLGGLVVLTNVLGLAIYQAAAPRAEERLNPQGSSPGSAGVAVEV